MSVGSPPRPKPLRRQHFAPLTRLRAAGIVSSRKNGTHVTNALADPAIVELVNRAEQICR